MGSFVNNLSVLVSADQFLKCAPALFVAKRLRIRAPASGWEQRACEEGHLPGEEAKRRDDVEHDAGRRCEPALLDAAREVLQKFGALGRVHAFFQRERGCGAEDAPTAHQVPSCLARSSLAHH